MEIIDGRTFKSKLKDKLLQPPHILRGYYRHYNFDMPPIVIGGCERSGTTLLERILSAHSNILAIGEETWGLCYGPKAGFSKSKNPIQSRRLMRGLGKVPIPKNKTPKRWVEKSPANIYYFDEIHEAFNGRLQRIQIVRDGRDVVLSRYPQSPKKVWVSAKRWEDSVLAGLKYIEDESVLTIRYEDLILDTENTVKRLFEFLDEDDENLASEWHLRSTIKDVHSGNLRPIPKAEEAIGKMIKKTSNPSYTTLPGASEVDKLMKEPEALELLRHYNYL